MISTSNNRVLITNFKLIEMCIKSSPSEGPGEAFIPPFLNFPPYFVGKTGFRFGCLKEKIYFCRQFFKPKR